MPHRNDFLLTIHFDKIPFDYSFDRRTMSKYSKDKDCWGGQPPPKEENWRLLVPNLTIPWPGGFRTPHCDGSFAGRRGKLSSLVRKSISSPPSDWHVEGEQSRLSSPMSALHNGDITQWAPFPRKTVVFCFCFRSSLRKLSFVRSRIWNN